MIDVNRLLFLDFLLVCGSISSKHTAWMAVVITASWRGRSAANAPLFGRGSSTDIQRNRCKTDKEQTKHRGKERANEHEIALKFLLNQRKVHQTFLSIGASLYKDGASCKAKCRCAHYHRALVRVQREIFSKSCECVHACVYTT